MAEQAQTARQVVALLKTAPYEELEPLIERYLLDPRAQVERAVTSAIKRYQKESAVRAHTAELYREMERYASGGIVVGIDEVGRGPLAGPLAVGAVVLPKEPMIWGLDDSKRLTPQRREELAACIKRVALAASVVMVDAAAIDALGMGRALKYAMREALDQTGYAEQASAVLIDGLPQHIHEAEVNVVKGDGKIAAIAAASIIAKVERDALMVELDQLFPVYGFAKNKGYGSAAHIAALRSHGLTPYHRTSFCKNFVETETLF